METYKAIFKKKEDKGVYSLSVVENPAMESEFIALNKQTNIKLAEVDDKEYILLGVALIPDKPIYRNQNGREFNLVFPKETIKETAHNFIQMGYQNNSSLEHETAIDGVSIVESWTVKDAKNDTANAYGLPKEDIVEGAWVVKMKCDNKDIYNKALSGEIKGFSIDALLSLELINNDVQMKKSKFSLSALTDFLNSFTDDTQEEVQLGKVILENDVQVEFEGEQLAQGVNVYVMVEADEGQEPRKEALPDGDYKTKEGEMFAVKDGVVATVGEQAPSEAPTDEMEMSDVESMIKSILVKYSEDAKKETLQLSTDNKKEVDELKASYDLKFSKLEKENAEMQKQILEFSKLPKEEIRKSAPTQKKG